MKSATSFAKPGLQDWILQRISAVVLAVYLFFLLGYLLKHHPLQYQAWHDLYTQEWVRILSLGALLSLMLHAWIGLWTISTDYIKARWLRCFFQMSVFIVLLNNLVWGIEILWGTI